MRSPTVSSWGPVNRASPLITSTLRPRAIAARPPVSLSTTETFQVQQRLQVDLGLGEADSPLGHLTRLGDHPSGVQQRLGGDAADVEAHAAEPVIALDEHRLEAEVGGAERCRVAAGARADDDHVGVVVAVVVGAPTPRARAAPSSRRRQPVRRRARSRPRRCAPAIRRRFAVGFASGSASGLAFATRQREQHAALRRRGRRS